MDVTVRHSPPNSTSVVLCWTLSVCGRSTAVEDRQLTEGGQFWDWMHGTQHRAATLKQDQAEYLLTEDAHSKTSTGQGHSMDKRTTMLEHTTSTSRVHINVFNHARNCKKQSDVHGTWINALPWMQWMQCTTMHKWTRAQKPRHNLKKHRSH